VIYLVSNQQSLWESDKYELLDKKVALDMIMAKNSIEYDSETEGLDCHTKRLLCSQYGLGKDQIVVDNTSIDIEYFRPVFEDVNKELLGWNIGFDCKFLYKHHIVPYKVWDGMIAEKLLYLGYPAQYHSMSLQKAALNYLGIDLDKTVRGKIINVGLTEDVIVYAAHDVVYLTSIREKQMIELKKKDLIKAVEFENEFVPVISYMSYCGAKLDPVKWKTKMIKDQEAAELAEKNLNKWVEDYYNSNKSDTEDYYINKSLRVNDFKNENEVFKAIPSKARNVKVITTDNGRVYSFEVPFKFVKRNYQGDLFNGYSTEPRTCVNWSSSKQVVPLLELLGLNCDVLDKKTKKMKKSADIKTIEPQKYKSTIVEPYIAYKKAEIVVNTFGQKFLDAINPVTGRIHPNYNSLGADTGRLSASDPSLMNLPKNEFTRSCFIAEKGNKWISLDYSGQESFLMASIANDKAMLDELINGSGDMHSLTAKMVFKDLPEDVTLQEIKEKYPEHRSEAKKYEFLFNYGGDWNTIMRNFGLKKERAKEIYDNYMSGFSGLRDYQDKQRRFVVEHGYILLNPITKHKAFIYDWDMLNKINDELGTIEGSYAMRHRYTDPDNEYVQSSRILSNRIATSQKQAINYPIQHCGSMCFKLSAIKFFRWLKKENLLFKVLYCVPVHDEHNVEAPEDMAEHIANILKLCMEQAGEPFCTRAKLTADINIGDYWIH